MPAPEGGLEGNTLLSPNILTVSGIHPPAVLAW